MTEDEMIGWHHQLNGHEFKQALGDSEGQESPVRGSPWGRRVRHDLVTEQQGMQSPRKTTRGHFGAQVNPTLG